MFSVMIVDDEKAIRENLPRIINFEEFGFKVCQTAKNGEDALEKLPQCRPDVIFLDVCMPVMDGLAFLREIHKRQDTNLPFVVMLSGYSDFEYARTAMRYGVKAYLTKPVEEEEVSSILAELRRTLEEKRKTAKTSDIREQVKALRVMYHSGDGDRTPFRGYRMTHCVVLKENGMGEESFGIIRKLTEERLSGGEEAFCRNQGSVLSYLIGPETLGNYQQSATLFARHLLHQIKKEGIECALLFDSVLFEKSEGAFRNDHDGNLYRMLTEVFWGRETVVQNNMPDAPDFQEGRLEKEEEYLEKMKQAIRNRDREMLGKVYENLIEAVEAKRLNVVFLQEIGYRIYYGMLDLLEKEQITDISVEPLDLRNAGCFVRFQEWKELLWKQILTVFTAMEKANPTGKQGIGEQAIAYIRNHFREQISLQSVADQFYVSSSYLGKCLQKALGGGNFRQYLNELRIEEAIRLLEGTDKKIYEIAEEVGFAESKYFISRFIDQAGMSPAEYRKRKNGQGNI